MTRRILLVVLSIVPLVFAQEKSSTPIPAGNQAAAMSDRASAYYHYALGHMYEENLAMFGRREDVEKAIQEYRLALAAAPSSSFLTASMAELYARTGRLQDAVDETQNAIKLDPGNLQAQNLLGRIYLRSLGQAQSPAQSREILQLATAQYETIVKLQPDSPDRHILLGRLYYMGQDWSRAENEFQTALKIDPNSQEAIASLAYVYNEAGHHDKAAQLLSSVPAASRSANLYAAMGYTDQQLKNYKKAIADYRQAVALDPENLDALRGLAQNLENDNQLDAALEQYTAIQRADPQDSDTAQRIVEIRRRLGKPDAGSEPRK